MQYFIKYIIYTKYFNEITENEKIRIMTAINDSNTREDKKANVLSLFFPFNYS